MPNPIPGGTIGRTDQGVDISARPGAAIYDPVPGVSQLVGKLSNWFRGQPYYYFKVLTGPFAGKYWSAAEQVDITTPQGGKVSQGQRIGRYAASGTATEFGWSTASGRTLAKATTGYTEGQVTPAGTDFRNRIINARPGKATGFRGGAAAVRSNPVPAYVPALYRPWVQRAAQGTSLPAPVVAAQIRAESNFDKSATSPTGAQGIAQFEPATWKSLGIRGNPYNPNDALTGYVALMNQLLKQYNGNIRMALAAYNAGPGNLAAGYGYADSILGKAGVPSSATASGSAGTALPISRPGGTPVTASGAGAAPSGAGVDALFTAYEAKLNLPRTAPSADFASLSSAGWKAPFQWWWQSFSGGNSPAPTAGP